MDRNEKQNIIWKGQKYYKRERANAQMRNEMIESKKLKKNKKKDEELSKYP